MYNIRHIMHAARRLRPSPFCNTEVLACIDKKKKKLLYRILCTKRFPKTRSRSTKEKAVFENMLQELPAVTTVYIGIAAAVELHIIRTVIFSSGIHLHNIHYIVHCLTRGRL